jgi:hypothetical protein
VGRTYWRGLREELLFLDGDNIIDDEVRLDPDLGNPGLLAFLSDNRSGLQSLAASREKPCASPKVNMPSPNVKILAFSCVKSDVRRFLLDLGRSLYVSATGLAMSGVEFMADARRHVVVGVVSKSSWQVSLNLDEAVSCFGVEKIDLFDVS